MAELIVIFFNSFIMLNHPSRTAGVAPIVSHLLLKFPKIGYSISESFSIGVCVNIPRPRVFLTEMRFDGRAIKYRSPRYWRRRQRSRDRARRRRAGPFRDALRAGRSCRRDVVGIEQAYSWRAALSRILSVRLRARGAVGAGSAAWHRAAHRLAGSFHSAARQGVAPCFGDRGRPLSLRLARAAQPLGPLAPPRSPNRKGGRPAQGPSDDRLCLFGLPRGRCQTCCAERR